MRPQYFTITGERSILYFMTGAKVAKLKKLFPGYLEGSKEGRRYHDDVLRWIEANGRRIGEVDCLAY